MAIQVLNTLHMAKDADTRRSVGGRSACLNDSPVVRKSNITAPESTWNFAVTWIFCPFPGGSFQEVICLPGLIPGFRKRGHFVPFFLVLFPFTGNVSRNPCSPLPPLSGFLVCTGNPNLKCPMVFFSWSVSWFGLQKNVINPSHHHQRSTHH